MNSASRVLVIGIDGGTFKVIDPLLEQGELPHIGLLLEQGVRSNLLSTFPPISAQAWTTFATGQNVGLHGLFDFAQKVPGQYRRELTNATHCRSKTLWQILSERGKSVIVTNVPMTYPVRPVRGIMVSWPWDYGLTDDTMFPSSLVKDVEETIGHYESSAGISKAVAAGDLGSATELLELSTKQTLKLAKYLLSRAEWSLGVVVFDATDKAQHYFWKYMDPDHPLYPGSSAFEKVIVDTYKHVDVAIGELLADYANDAWIILISDHGFGPISGRAIHLNTLLEKHGYLAYKELPRRTQMVRSSLGGILQMVQWLPKRVLTRLKNVRGLRKVRNTLRKARNTKLSIEHWGDIDFKKTAVFADETRGVVWINLRGREHYGFVDSGSQYENLIAQVREMIEKELRDPETQGSLVNKIYTKAELFPVDLQGGLPDLVIDLSIEPVLSFQPSSNLGTHISPVRIMSKSELEHSFMKVINGFHRRDGIFALFNSDPNPRAIKFGALTLEDIAPTILYLLDEPVPSSMTGVVPPELIEMLSKHGYGYPRITKEETHLGDNEERRTYNDDEEQIVAERLKDLGYL